MRARLGISLGMLGALVVAAGGAPHALACEHHRAPAAAKAADKAPEKTSGYTCPMHPEVKSEKPGSCPICKMDLVAAKAAAPEEKATLEVSDAQLANLGLRAVEARREELTLTVRLSGRFMNANSIVFPVMERDLALVRKGMSFRGTAAGQPGRKLRGQITGMDSMVDPMSRTVRVVGTLSEAAPNALPEMSFSAEGVAYLGTRLVVPADAVLHSGSRDLVFVMREQGRIEPRAVVLGARSDSRFEIVSGLRENERVTVGANFLLDSEARIRGIAP